MSEQVPGPQTIAACFGLKEPLSLRMRPFQGAELVVVYLDGRESRERQVELPVESAFFLMLYLVDVEHQDLGPSGAITPFRTYPRGSICLVDLADGASIAIRGAFEALAIVIPHACLEELADAGELAFTGLRTCRGTEDEVLRSIGAALIGIFDMPSQESKPLLESVGVAITAHLAHHYGKPKLSVSHAEPSETLH